MKCRDVVELMTAYIEGSLPAEERTRFDEHIALCDGCHAYLEQLRMTIKLSGRLVEEPIPAKLEAELMRVFRDWKRRD